MKVIFPQLFTLFRGTTGAAFLLAFASGAGISLGAPAQPQAAIYSDYILRPMDLIKVQVFQEPDLDRELRVSQDHTIKLPLIGSIDLRKRTVRDTEKMIADLYNKDYLVNPQINITILEYSPRTVNVLGAVNAPGSVVITTEHKFTLLDVIARSGGFSRLANKGKLSLTRTMADGETQNFTIDGDQLVSGDANTTWIVQDGDVIFVPERIL
jgi:polysaccharide export outer membrane protein